MKRRPSWLDFIKSYFHFLYSTGPKRVVHIGAVNTSGKKKEGEDSPAISVGRRKNFITVVVTVTMTFLIVGSFICVIVFACVFPDREVPQIIRDILIATLGYFGGTMMDFIKTSDK